MLIPPTPKLIWPGRKKIPPSPVFCRASGPGSTKWSPPALLTLSATSSKPAVTILGGTNLLTPASAMSAGGLITFLRARIYCRKSATPSSWATSSAPTTPRWGLRLSYKKQPRHITRGCLRRSPLLIPDLVLVRPQATQSGLSSANQSGEWLRGVAVPSNASRQFQYPDGSATSPGFSMPPPRFSVPQMVRTSLVAGFPQELECKTFFSPAKTL